MANRQIFNYCFPKVLNRALNTQIFSLCWGVGCQEHWYWIVSISLVINVNTFHFLEPYNNNNNDIRTTRLVQVKASFSSAFCFLEWWTKMPWGSWTGVRNILLSFHCNCYFEACSNGTGSFKVNSPLYSHSCMILPNSLLKSSKSKDIVMLCGNEFVRMIRCYVEKYFLCLFHMSYQPAWWCIRGLSALREGDKLFTFSMPHIILYTPLCSPPKSFPPHSYSMLFF